MPDRGESVLAGEESAARGRARGPCAGGRPFGESEIGRIGQRDVGAQRPDGREPVGGREPRRESTPCRTALARARASASTEASRANAREAGRSSRYVMARIPLPVPRSSSRTRLRRFREGRLEEDLRLGAGHERAPVDGEGAPVEVPLAEQVLHRRARHRLRHRESNRARASRLDLSPRIERQGTRAPQRVRQQDAGVPGCRLGGFFRASSVAASRALLAVIAQSSDLSVVRIGDPERRGPQAPIASPLSSGLGELFVQSCAWKWAISGVDQLVEVAVEDVLPAGGS